MIPIVPLKVAKNVKVAVFAQECLSLSPHYVLHNPHVRKCTRNLPRFHWWWTTSYSTTLGAYAAKVFFTLSAVPSTVSLSMGLNNAFKARTDKAPRIITKTKALRQSSVVQSWWTIPVFNVNFLSSRPWIFLNSARIFAFPPKTFYAWPHMKSQDQRIPHVGAKCYQVIDWMRNIIWVWEEWKRNNSFDDMLRNDEKVKCYVYNQKIKARDEILCSNKSKYVYQRKW